MKRLPLNRLWLQFSLAFGAMVIVAVMSVIFVGIMLRSERPPVDPATPPPTEEQQLEFRTRMRQVFAQSLISIVAIGGAIGVAAGIWMSRRMTAPLEELANGTKRIGAGELTHRVQPQGSEEMLALAQSFNQMAAQLQKEAQMRQNLLADVAHELRTPLTVLQGNLRAMLDDVYPLNKSEVAHLYDQTRHLNRLVNDLRELAQAEAHQLPLMRQETDLIVLVDAAVDSFAPIAEEHSIQLERLLPAQKVLVSVDRARMTQVLQNLLSNALRHTPRTGQITVGVSQENGMARVSVCDSGDGIEAAQLPYLFDRFYRTDRSRDRDSGGAGLGLAIVRALTELHNGSVSVSSQGTGHGTTFSVELPLWEDAEQHAPFDAGS
ncbi:MAG: HAMP domain-containing protein [Caldilineaceae bacterium]|nr:HAMP domain-containing protein [Caldilineaceae bacterium]